MVPVGLAGYYGFFKWNGIGPLTDFVGLDNYVRELSATRCSSARCGTTLLLRDRVAPRSGPLALGIALLLNRRMRGRSFFRVLVFVPYVLSEVDRRDRLVARPAAERPFDALLRVSGSGLVQLWLGDPTLVLWTMLVVITWKYIGFAIILFLAGLQGVPGGARRGRADRRRIVVAGSSGTSRSRCSARPSGSGRSCRSSARCSSSTWCGS